MAKKIETPKVKAKAIEPEIENDNVEETPEVSKFSEVFKETNLALDDMQEGTDAMIKIKLQNGQSVSRLNNIKKDLVRLKKELSVYSNE